MALLILEVVVLSRRLCLISLVNFFNLKIFSLITIFIPFSLFIPFVPFIYSILFIPIILLLPILTIILHFNLTILLHSILFLAP